MDKTLNTIILIGLGIVVGMELQKQKMQATTPVPTHVSPSQQLYTRRAPAQLPPAVGHTGAKTMFHLNA